MSSLGVNATGLAKASPLSLVLRDSAVLPLFSLGEESTITIVQRISARQYLVTVKDRKIMADSELPLQVGNEIKVRVDQQHPRLVLKILSEGSGQRDIFAEGIRFFRANPQGLLTGLLEAEDLLARALHHPRLPPALHDDIRSLLHQMQKLRYSHRTAGNRDYLRDYTAELGMFMESGVKKALLAKGERELRDNGSLCGVKGLLSLLAKNLSALLGDDALPGEIRLSLEQLHASAEKTVRSIENQQILNVMLRETENASLLQIPLLFPGGVKLAEVFIQGDNHAGSRSGDRHSFSVALLLDMDMLGHLLIELHVHDKMLECRLKCSEEAVQSFISSHLPELQEKLRDLGYHAERLTCVVEDDLENQKTALCRNYRLYTDESINIFA